MSVPSPFTKGAPDAPDYQGAANKQTQANRPNQYSPWASSAWAPGGSGTGPRTIHRGGETIELPGGGPSGEMQQQIGLAPQLDQANQSMMGQLAGAWSGPLDNGADARKHAEDAIYGSATSRLNPIWDQQQHDMQTQLANQGIDPNSVAYGKQLDNFGRSRNDAYNQALYGAIMGGGQEASRQQQLDLTSRLAPLQAMGALKGLTGMPQPGAAGDYLGAARSAGQYGLDAQNMNQGFWNDLISGGVGAAKGFKIPGFAGF